MIIVCAWCHTFQGIKDAEYSGTTHTICPSCLETQKRILQADDAGNGPQVEQGTQESISSSS